MGYLYLCCELQRRTEAFSTICQLDDISLLEEPDGKAVFQSLHSFSQKKLRIGYEGSWLHWDASGPVMYYTLLVTF